MDIKYLEQIAAKEIIETYKHCVKQYGFNQYGFNHNYMKNSTFLYSWLRHSHVINICQYRKFVKVFNHKNEYEIKAFLCICKHLSMNTNTETYINCLSILDKIYAYDKTYINHFLKKFIKYQNIILSEYTAVIYKGALLESEKELLLEKHKDNYLLSCVLNKIDTLKRKDVSLDNLAELNIVTDEDFASKLCQLGLIDKKIAMKIFDISIKNCCLRTFKTLINKNLIDISIVTIESILLLIRRNKKIIDQNLLYDVFDSLELKYKIILAGSREFVGECISASLHYFVCKLLVFLSKYCKIRKVNPMEIFGARSSDDSYRTYFYGNFNKKKVKNITPDILDNYINNNLVRSKVFYSSSFSIKFGDNLLYLRDDTIDYLINVIKTKPVFCDKSPATIDSQSDIKKNIKICSKHNIRYGISNRHLYKKYKCYNNYINNSFSAYTIQKLCVGEQLRKKLHKIENIHDIDFEDMQLTNHIYYNIKIKLLWDKFGDKIFGNSRFIYYTILFHSHLLSDNKTIIEKFLDNKFIKKYIDKIDFSCVTLVFLQYCGRSSYIYKTFIKTYEDNTNECQILFLQKSININRITIDLAILNDIITKTKNDDKHHVYLIRMLATCNNAKINFEYMTSQNLLSYKNLIVLLLIGADILDVVKYIKEFTIEILIEYLYHYVLCFYGLSSYLTIDILIALGDAHFGFLSNSDQINILLRIYNQNWRINFCFVRKLFQKNKIIHKELYEKLLKSHSLEEIDDLQLIPTDMKYNLESLGNINSYIYEELKIMMTHDIENKINDTVNEEYVRIINDI